MFPLGQTTVTWTVTDPSGQSATATQIVTISDVAPTITAPIAVSVPANSLGGATGVSLGVPVVGSIAYDVSVLTIVNDAPALFPLGQTTVTWTVTDPSGQSATATQIVTISDVAPTITAPIAVSVPANSLGGATGVSLGVPVVGSIAYDVSVLTIVNDAPALFPLGQTTVTWTVTDPSGQSATATQIVTISDVAPTITAPIAVSVPANSLGGATGVSLGVPVVGSIAYDVSVLTIVNDAPALFPLGQTTVTWTVTDPSGQSATATQIVTISDVAPTITAPIAVSVPANSLGGATGVSLGVPVVGSIAYDVSVLTIVNDAPALFPLGQTTVTWTVTDPSGQSATATQIVTISDVAPTITAPIAVSVPANSLGGATGVSLGVPVVGSIAYDVSVLTIVNDAPALFPLGQTTVTWTVTDPSGQSATATQIVTISDVAPTITAPIAVSVPANSLGGATGVSLGVPVVGSIAYDVSVLTIVNDAPALFPLGQTTVTWTVTDPSGQSATATQIVTISDVAPTITAPIAVSVPANSLGGATGVSLGVPVVGSIAYDVSVLTIVNDAPALFPLGQTTVTWTVTDPSGQSATATQIVTISDVAPTITAPIAVSVPANSLGGATGVSLGVPVVGSIAYDVSVLTIVNDAPALFPLGQTTVTWTVTDPSGQSATATQIVTISDVAPTITAPIAVSVPANSLGGATGVSLGVPVVGSIAYDVSVLTIVNDAPALFPLGQTTVTWTVTDPSGQSATATQIVTISDVAPTITAPIAVSVPANSLGGATGVSLGVPVVGSIAYDVSVLTIVNDAPALFPLGQTTVTWTVTDPSGQSATATQIVTISDVAPTITAPIAVSVPANSLGGATGVSLGVPVVGSIAYDVSVLTIVNDAPALFPLGQTTVTWTVTDPSGQSATATQIVTISDVAPTITAPIAVSVPANSLGGATGVSLGVPVVGSIAYDVSVLTIVNDAPALFPLGQTTVTWTVTDPSGQSATATQIVTISDVAPTITAPIAVSVPANSLGGATGVSLGVPVVGSIAYDVSVLTIVNDAPALFPLGQTTVTWTVTDPSGQSATATQIVTISDVAPTITAPIAVSVPANSLGGATGVSLGVPVVGSIAYDVSVLTIVNDAPALFPLGQTTVTWTVTDPSGQSATATQIVTISDVAPTITAPIAVSVPANSLGGATGVSLGVPVVGSIAYDVSVLTIVNDAPALFPLGQTTVTWTVTDPSGQSATATQIVTISDVAPTITAPIAVSVPANSLGGATGVSLGVPVVGSIAYDVSVLTIVNDAPALFPLGQTTVTWTVTDPSGQSATATQIVTISDVAPTITAPIAVSVPANSLGGATGVSLGVPVVGSIAYDVSVLTIVNDAPALFPLGQTTVTWTVTDPSGQSATATQIVTISDVAPTITAPIAVSVPANSLGGATGVSLGVPVVGSIAYDVSVLTIVNDAPALFPLGQTTVTWTVTDPSGQSATATQIVTISDVAPTITAPIAVSVPANSLGGATGVSLGVPVVGSIAYDVSVLTIVNDAPALFPLGQTTVTWTVTDPSGQSATATQIVTISDVAPTITAPIAVSVPANSLGGATGVSLGVPVVGSIAYDVSVLTIVNDAPALFPLGQTTVTWTVTDPSGQSATATQIVTISDVAPTITAPIAVSVPANSLGGATGVSLGVPVVGSIAYDVSVLTIVNDAPALFPLGQTTVTWTVTDPSGQSATATQIVTISDVAPTITAPIAVSVPANSLGGATGVSLGVPVVGSIAYDVSVLTIVNDAPALFPLGQTTVTWTVTDPSGQSATATQIVTISDVAPTITAPIAVSVPANSLGGATGVSLGVPVVGSIAYDVSVLTIVNDAPALFPLGQTTVTWTVTDPSGQSATATQIVTISDVAPTITAPIAVSVPANSLGGATGVSLGVPVVGSIAYDVSVLTIVNDAPALFPLGQTTVTWTVTDPSGQSATATQIVTISDVAPTITAPIAVSVPANSLGGATGVSLGVPVVGSIAYDVSVLTIVNDAPALFPLGQTTVTWTVTDPSGQSATATQIVTISDVAPTITAPIAVSVPANSLGGATGVSLGVPVVGSIAYDVSVLTIVNDAPALFPLGQTTVTWTVTDPSGQSATATQIVTISDVAPTITAPIAVSVPANSLGGATGVSLGVPVVGSIAYDVSVLTIVNDAPALFPLGQTTVTWTVTDPSGQSATATQIVTISDVAPTITAPIAVSVPANSLGGATGVSLGVPVVGSIAYDVSVLTIVNDAPALFPLGQTTVTWTVTDPSGQSATATQIVTISDVAPTITAPIAVSVPANSLGGATGVSLGVPVVGSIAYDVSVLTIVNDAPALFPLGQTTVTWTVTDPSGQSATATQIVTVTVGSLASIVVTGPTSIAAGATATFTAEGFDSAGNSLGDVTGSGVWGIDSAAKGSWSSNVYITEVAGSWTVTANVNSIHNTVHLTVNAAAATHFEVSAPSTATAGIPFSITVTAYYAYGNIATGYTGTVHFTSTAAGTLPGNSVLTGGTGTFTVTLTSTGTQTITAADTITSSITGTCGSIAITSLIPPTTSINLSGTLGLNGWYTSSVTITLTATDHSGTGINAIHYTVDSGNEQIIAGSTTTFTISATGTHSITYWAIDNIGNTEMQNIQQIKIDLTTPTTTAILSGTHLQSDPSWYVGIATVTLSASESSSGVDKTYYSLNGINYNVYTAPLQVSAPGTTLVYFYSTDHAGDVETVKTIQVKIAYTITPSAPGAGSGGSINPSVLQNVVYGATPTFIVTPEAGYHLLDLKVDGVSVLTGMVGYSYTFPPVSTNHEIVATFSAIGTNADSYLVVRGANNQIYYRTCDSVSGTWGSWIGLPGSTIDSPAAVVCGNELHIVVRGSDGITLWHSYVNLNDGTFSGWEWISGTTPSPPTLASNGNIVTLVVRGADNSVYYRVYAVQTRSWGDWKVFASGSTCDKVAAAMQGNELDVVVRGYSPNDPSAQNSLWQASVNLDSGVFSGWTWIPGSVTSSPTLTAWQNGYGYCLVVRGSDNSIYINKYEGSAWQGWAALQEGSTYESPAATVIGDKLCVIVVGMDSVTLWQSDLDLNSNSFSGWRWISGTTPSKPTFTS